MSLTASGVGASAGRRRLLDGVSVVVEPGTVHALLGPNGAGKTTLLRLLAGERAPDAGEVAFDGHVPARWHGAGLARRRAVLTQGDTLRFPLTAEEVVMLGRLPHAPEPASTEARIVRAALEAADAGAFAPRSYPTLSGGERTRVRLARALAQVWEQFESAREARYLLLDEPAAHLDLGHQHFAMRLLRRFADAGGGVLVTLHDPNLALAYADTASLIVGGRLVASGACSDVLTVELLGPLYDMQAQRIERADGPPVLVWTAPGRAHG